MVDRNTCEQVKGPLKFTGAKVEAQFKDGLLTIHLPKDEKAKPKTVEVKLN